MLYLILLKIKLNKINFITVMEELVVLRCNHLREQFNNFVDDNLKMVAFNLVKKHGQQPLRMIVTAFDLKENKLLFMDKINEFIKMHYYKEVSWFVLKLFLNNY